MSMKAAEMELQVVTLYNPLVRTYFSPNSTSINCACLALWWHFAIRMVSSGYAEQDIRCSRHGARGFVNKLFCRL
jgi:hypothetical protein